MNKTKPANRARLALPLQSILLILLIGGIGVLTLTSCSSDDGDGPPPPLVTSSSSVDGNSSSSGGDGGGDSSSSVDGDSSSSGDGGGDDSSSSVSDSSSSGDGEDSSSSSEDGDSSSSVDNSSSSGGSIVSCPNPSVSDNSISCGGQTYRTVNINGQVWFAENLNWGPGSGISACYDNNSANCDTYGRLYDWATALLVCPDGWHLPSDAEWGALTDYVGSDEGTKLKSATGWNQNGNGTDDYGFSALPGGQGHSDVSFFGGVGDIGYWWSTTERNSIYVWFRSMGYNGISVSRNNTLKSRLHSVRCIQDGGDNSSSSINGSSSSSPNVVYGKPVTYGDETYQTVIIGNQTWFARNLNYNPGTGNSDCYDNDLANCVTYGRLYDWSTAMGIDASFNNSLWGGSDVKHRGICPEGWHIPSNDDWGTLINYAGGSSVAGTKLKATSGWFYNSDGTDDYGFSAMPGGYNSGAFNGVDNYGYWWSSTEYNSSYAWYRTISYEDGYVGKNYGDYKFFLRSVRCIQD